jgi:hypothetical protein
MFSLTILLKEINFSLHYEPRTNMLPFYVRLQRFFLFSVTTTMPTETLKYWVCLLVEYIKGDGSFKRTHTLILVFLNLFPLAKVVFYHLLLIIK